MATPPTTTAAACEPVRGRRCRARQDQRRSASRGRAAIDVGRRPARGAACSRRSQVPGAVRRGRGVGRGRELGSTSPTDVTSFTIAMTPCSVSASRTEPPRPPDRATSRTLGNGPWDQQGSFGLSALPWRPPGRPAQRGVVSAAATGRRRRRPRRRWRPGRRGSRRRRRAGRRRSS